MVQPGRLQAEVHRLAIERLARVSVAARQAVESVLAGSHRSVRRGLSVEFAGHRPYQAGDDLRRLDWQVWARTDRYDVRLFEEETRLRCTLVLDASGSMAYAGAGRPPKLELARTVAAALAYLLVRAGDAAGLVVAGGGRQALPAGATMGHLVRLLAALERVEPAGGAGLAAELAALAPRLPRRGLVFVLSDGIEDGPALAAALGLLRRRRQDARLLLVRDADEVAFPFRGALEFAGLEGEPALRLDADRVRRFYQEAARGHYAALETACRAAGVPVAHLRGGEDPGLAVVRILADTGRGGRG